ncbi:hypothetical protein BaRGS_00029615 [Batillaria attramentaria]|uniref:BTB domain-containing protein n=1 Tax=Batillaria attramentaria TaxID=370345 RepID=A0ABD0JWV9_9CAEN
MNIGDVEIEHPSQTSLQGNLLPDGSGSASEGAHSQLCLTRKEFTEKALDILNELRNQGQLCDAVIKVDGESFSVHRNILSASSAYFKALFTSKGFQPVPRQPVQEVEMVDVTKDIMRCLIDYAYSRQVLITEANVEQILHAADR